MKTIQEYKVTDKAKKVIAELRAKNDDSKCIKNRGRSGI
jgi:hypothetical protein